jgi:hypothetical protein
VCFTCSRVCSVGAQDWSCDGYGSFGIGGTIGTMLQCTEPSHALGKLYTLIGKSLWVVTSKYLLLQPKRDPSYNFLSTSELQRRHLLDFYTSKHQQKQQPPECHLYWKQGPDITNMSIAMATRGIAVVAEPATITLVHWYWQLFAVIMAAEILRL